MKVWLLRETKHGRYAHRPGSTDPDVGELCACRWHSLTRDNWRLYDWYVLESKDLAEWYKDGVVRLLGDKAMDMPIETVEVDMSFNGFDDVDLSAVRSDPCEKKTKEVPPPSDGFNTNLNARQIHDVKQHLQTMGELLMDALFVANTHASPGIDALVSKAQNYLNSVQRTLFPDHDDDVDGYV